MKLLIGVFRISSINRGTMAGVNLKMG